MWDEDTFDEEAFEQYVAEMEARYETMRDDQIMGNTCRFRFDYLSVKEEVKEKVIHVGGE